jgi:hypothetical protein
MQEKERGRERRRKRERESEKGKKRDRERERERERERLVPYRTEIICRVQKQIASPCEYLFCISKYH